MKYDTPLISIVVPVYKVESFLDRCVESIVNQTYRNLEIILVDDGSPDNCPQMCDAWAAKDSRIRVIHQANAGGAAARNTALDVARGELIAFVDSDDYTAPDMYEKMFTELRNTKAEIVECAYMLVNDDDPPASEGSTRTRLYTTEEALYANLYNTACQQVIWNKLYWKHVIGKVRFVPGKTIDDEYFTYRVIARAGTIAVISDVLYFYRQHDTSIMHQKYSLKRLDALGACAERSAYIATHYPAIAAHARVNLRLTCMYHYQMAQFYLRGADKKTAELMVTETVMRSGLQIGDLKKVKGLTKWWLLLSKVNFRLVCHARNRLRIGL